MKKVGSKFIVTAIVLVLAFAAVVVMSLTLGQTTLVACETCGEEVVASCEACGGDGLVEAASQY